MDQRPLSLTEQEKLAGDTEDESQEQLDTAYKRLSDLVGDGRDGSLVTFGKTEMSLMQKILSTGTEKYRDQIFWRLVSFVDPRESMIHVNAYYEAVNLGMNTEYNVALMFALCSTYAHRTGTNLISQILDTLQHGKWAGNQQKRGNDGAHNRSPLSG